MNWLHLRQTLGTPSVRNTSDSGGPRLESVPGRSEQGKPWSGPPTWTAFTCLDCFLGLADDYVTTKLPLQSPKSLVAHVLLSPPLPHANSFVIGPAVIKHTNRLKTPKFRVHTPKARAALTQARRINLNVLGCGIVATNVLSQDTRN